VDPRKKGGTTTKSKDNALELMERLAQLWTALSNLVVFCISLQLEHLFASFFCIWQLIKIYTE